MTYGATYTSTPYAGTIYEPKKVLPRGGIPLVTPEVFFFFGPQVGVRNLDGSGRIRGFTVVTGNLNGGVYIPPDTGGGGTTPSLGLNGDISDVAVVTGTMSGGRAVTYLTGVRINGRTNLLVTMSGGTVRQRTYLFGQKIVGKTALLAIMDGGEEAIIVAGSTDVTADMSGGVATADLIQLQGYPIVMSPPVTGTMSGGKAVIALAGTIFANTSPSATINPSLPGVKKLLAGRPRTFTIVTANLTGGKPYTPPPPDPVPGSGNLVLSGDIRITASVTFNAGSPSTTSAPEPPGGPTDLPTDVDGSVPSNPRVELLESIGFGMYGPSSETVVSSGRVFLCGQDVHSPEDPLTYAIKANSDGTPSYSYERWLRVRFVPPFGLVGQFRFWVDDLPIPDGWFINWGWTNTYKVPTDAPSQIATSPVPTFDPGISNSNFGDSIALDGRQIRYTAYLVLQAYFVPPLTHEGDLIEPLPGLSYNIAFVQS